MCRNSRSSTVTRALRTTTRSSRDLGLENAPDGLVVHSAGFDNEKGVFRIFDVWESRQAGEQWMETVLNPVLERVMSQASEPDSLTPPTADYSVRAARLRQLTMN